MAANPTTITLVYHALDRQTNSRGRSMGHVAIEDSSISKFTLRRDTKWGLITKV